MSTDYLQVPGEGRKSAMEWRARLHAARSESEVLAIASEFVASFTPIEWDLLGKDPTAAGFENGAQLGAFSVDVVRRAAEADRHAELLLASMVSFFTDASAQLAFLGNPRNRAQPNLRDA
jgi:hypothetical protein